MTDYLNAFLKWVNHNRYSALSLLPALAFVVASFGCQPKAESPFTGKPATEAQIIADAQAYVAQQNATLVALVGSFNASLAKLEAEGEGKAAAVEAALAEIAQKREAIEKALAIVNTAATTAAPGYGELITGGLTTIGIAFGIGVVGRVADVARKDAVIAALKKPAATTGSPSTAV